MWRGSGYHREFGMVEPLLAEARVPFIERRLAGLARVVDFYDFKRQLFLCLQRMLVLRQLASEYQRIVFRHQLVRDTHQFTEHVGWRFVNTNKIAQALAHLLDAIETFQNR